MKRFLTTLLVTGMLVGGMTSVASAQVQPLYLLGSDKSVNVYVNGKRLQVDQPAIVKNGRTLVPLRAIFEALGATIQWDEKTQMITAERDQTMIQLALNSKVAVVKGTSVTLDVPAVSVNYRTMVPVRFVSEALDAHVAWDGGTSSVFVSQYSGQSIIKLSEYANSITDTMNELSQAAAESDGIYKDYFDKKINAQEFHSQYDANLEQIKRFLDEFKTFEVPEDQLTQRYADQTVQLFDNLYKILALRESVFGETASLNRLQELKADNNQMLIDKDAYEKEFSFLSELNQ